MVLVMILDLVFVCGSVYLFLTEQVVPGVVMLLMGALATGIGVMRVLSNRSVPIDSRTGFPLLRGA